MDETSHGSHIYSPEFIPMYIGIKIEYKLLDPETMIYGFIRFYTANTKNPFYFTNEQLGEMFGYSMKTVSQAITKLSKLELIETTFKIKAGGGKIRFVGLANFTRPTSKKVTSDEQKSNENKNKINDNKINEKNINIPQSEANKQLIPDEPIIDKRDLRIDAIIEHLKETNNLETLDRTYQNNRRFGKLLLDKVKKMYPDNDEVLIIKDLISIAAGINYYKNNMTSMQFIYYNINKIINQSKEQVNKNTWITI